MNNAKTLDDLVPSLNDDSWVWKDDMITFPDNDPQEYNSTLPGYERRTFSAWNDR